MPQTFNKVHENAREGCIFLNMALKPQDIETGHDTGHTPVNGTDLTGPDTEGRLPLLPHPDRV